MSSLLIRDHGMALTEQDRETVELIATRIAVHFHEGQKEALKDMYTAINECVQKMIEHHQATCPHGKKLLESKWFLAGAVVLAMVLLTGCSAAGGWVLKLLTGI